MPLASTHILSGFCSQSTRVSGFTKSEYDSSSIPSFKIPYIWAWTSSRNANGIVLELTDLVNWPTILKWYSNPLHFHGRLVRCGWYFIKTASNWSRWFSLKSLYSLILAFNLLGVITLSSGVLFIVLIVWYVSLIVVWKQFTAVLGVVCTVVSTFSLSYSRIILPSLWPSLSLTHWHLTAVNTAHLTWTGHLNAQPYNSVVPYVRVPLNEHNFSQYKHI